MEFKQATSADLDEVVAILQNGKQQLAQQGIDQWQGDYPSLDVVKAAIAAEQTFLVAADDKQTVGTITIQPAPDHYYEKLNGTWRLQTDDYVSIHRVAIHSDHAGKGYATRLFTAVINYIATHRPHLKSIRIDTHEDNGAMQYLLNKLGFKQVGTLVDVYRKGEISYVYEYLPSQD